eukprot:TRINITY_DN49003_c0_g1_i1.p1 TRINITY_DN49003_c0_g1~~TRINITY_DN49003_c0_g1_i1.p1  ORF type:complete len:262 (+),score=60.40 TRINITY_DN49003_c0_g1_i1:105-890(+)
MAVLQEIRDIFEDEIEAYLTRLRDHSFSTAADSSFSRNAQDAVKRLATEMTNGVVRRLEQNSELWVPGQDRNPAEDATVAEVRRATEAENLAARQRATERCRELEVELQRKLEEERQCSAELVRQFEASYGERLGACDQELQRIRQEVSFRQNEDPGHGASDGHSSEAAAAIRRDFMEYMERIRQNIETAKNLVSRLDAEQQDLDGFEQQQKQGLTDIELVLAGAYEEEDGDDTADRNLLEAIRHGEQVCKRMRHHVDNVV